MKNRHDYYFNKAKQEKYRARSVYKLEEAQKKYKFLKSSDNIIDIGCCPGSWTQYLLEHIVRSGSVFGVDILESTLSHQKFTFLQKDIKEVTSDDVDNMIFDVAVSDAMPNTTGDVQTNHFRSINLANAIAQFVIEHLKEDGFFFIKVYDGGDLPAFKKYLKKYFAIVDTFKPKSSRDESREVFLFCKGFSKDIDE